jgi:sec-independent protein translocase protein TatA
MFENVGGGEILVILLVILIFFGPKKMPELGKNIGKGIREFRKAMRDIQDGVEKSIKDGTEPPLDELKKSVQNIRDDIQKTINSTVNPPDKK